MAAAKLLVHNGFHIGASNNYKNMLKIKLSDNLCYCIKMYNGKLNKIFTPMNKPLIM